MNSLERHGVPELTFGQMQVTLFNGIEDRLQVPLLRLCLGRSQHRGDMRGPDSCIPLFADPEGKVAGLYPHDMRVAIESTIQDAYTTHARLRGRRSQLIHVLVGSQVVLA